MSLEEKKAKYAALLHAMQTGVAYEIERDNRSATPKHLRVGINAAMSDHGALVKLLMDKGIISEDEYFDALIEMMEREVNAYQTRLSEMYGGVKITLG